MSERSNMLIGFDLDADYSQISYLNRKEDRPVMVSSSQGGSSFRIPTAVCRLYESDKWYFGEEAVYYGENKAGYFIHDLVVLCQNDHKKKIEEMSYEAWEVLAVFLEQSMSLLNLMRGWESINSIMFTVHDVTRELLQAIQKACARFLPSRVQIFIQDHKESFYYYLLNQAKELWNYEVALFECREDKISCKVFRLNRGTAPVIATLDEKVSLPFIDASRQMDQQFLHAIDQTMGKQPFSSAFLIGERFDKSWMNRSLALLCNKRKVFQGENLYSKGACYALQERLEENKLGEYLYKGENMVYMNIGMDVMRKGNEAYYSLVQAGINWFEAKAECELIQDQVQYLELKLNPIDKHETKLYRISLQDFPKRPRRASRLLLKIQLLSVDECQVEVADLGFGELFPTNGKVKCEVIDFRQLDRKEGDTT